MPEMFFNTFNLDLTSVFYNLTNNYFLGIKGGIKMEAQDKSKEQTVFKVEDGGKSKKNVQPTTSGLDQNVAGLLCYLIGFITGIIFLLIEKENRFVRFHAMQSTIVFASIFILSLVLTIIPIIGWLLGLLLTPVSLILWIFLMWKAYQNKWIKLPVVGDIAEQQLDKSN